VTRHDEDRAILERVETDLDKHVAMIAQEFRDGFEAVDAIGRPAVTVYGSARITAGDPAYERAREIGRQFAEKGFAVVTGGGPGIMEAANKGADDA
jgi:predicted Rossmann-fold nucleotide-binding protein